MLYLQLVALFYSSYLSVIYARIYFTLSLSLSLPISLSLPLSVYLSPFLLSLFLSICFFSCGALLVSFSLSHLLHSYFHADAMKHANFVAYVFQVQIVHIIRCVPVHSMNDAFDFRINLSFKQIKTVDWTLYSRRMHIHGNIFRFECLQILLIWEWTHVFPAYIEKSKCILSRICNEQKFVHRWKQMCKLHVLFFINRLPRIQLAWLIGRSNVSDINLQQ